MDSKYVLKLILNVALAALLLIITMMYIVKTHPILKLLALVIDALAIFNVYKLIKNKPKNHE
tara:strand:- start:290 stop:475 length:186 start_codon:yes stop_codon:yes gene_type:complete